ncbi:hypothetical protein SANTM175S_01914 [Streptomyces antimycoticus]
MEEFVEAVGARGLRGGHGTELRQVHVGERGVLSDTGGVEDGPDRLAVRREPVDQCGHLLAVGHVGGHDPYPGARLLQFGGQVGGTGGAVAAA